jgi:hypothetical protein
MVRARRNALQKERRWLKRQGGKDGQVARKKLTEIKQSCAGEIDPQVTKSRHRSLKTVHRQLFAYSKRSNNNCTSPLSLFNFAGTN